MIQKLQTILMQFAKLVKYSSLLKTLYINIRTLPICQAMHFPILIGRRVQLSGIRKGCFAIQEGNPKLFSIMIGVPSAYSVYAPNREHSMLRFSDNGTMVFGLGEGVSEIRLLSGCSITVNGCIKFGDDVILNQHCTIFCAKEISIGNHVGVGWNTQILDSDLHFLYDSHTDSIRPCSKPVIISDNVWVGNSCSISKGVFIPKYSIIASRSLVTCDFSGVKTTGNLFAGSPARFIRDGLFRIMSEKMESMLKDYFSKDEFPEYKVKGKDDIRMSIKRRR